MNKRARVWWLALLLPVCAWGEVFHAAFFNPQAADDPFWKPVTEVMQAAAKELDIRLDVYVSNHNRLLMIEQVRQAVTAEDKPDVILFKNAKQTAAEILKLAEAHQVDAFLFNAGLSAEERRALGGPREKFRYWIGQMLPDDYQAGFDLARMLVMTAHARSLALPGQPVNLLAIGGTAGDEAAESRREGLMAALKEAGAVRLLQYVSANWNQTEAYRKTEGLLRRYPRVHAIWAANDPMALGAIQAANEAGQTAGSRILIGGIDWNPPALKAVQEGALLATLGGHFMEGGFALVVLYDYFRGKDFADTGGTTLNTHMGLLHAGNINQYIREFSDENWSRIRFSDFSLVLNPDQPTYDFSLNRVLEAM